MAEPLAPEPRGCVVLLSSALVKARSQARSRGKSPDLYVQKLYYFQHIYSRTLQPARLKHPASSLVCYCIAIATQPWPLGNLRVHLPAADQT